MVSEYPSCSPWLQERLVETYFQRDFETERLVANAVLVDMEPKVVTKCLAESRKEKDWHFSEKFAHCKQSGSGNNWALGYCNYASEQEQVGKRIQSLLERIDYFGGF